MHNLMAAVYVCMCVCVCVCVCVVHVWFALFLVRPKFAQMLLEEVSASVAQTTLKEVLPTYSSVVSALEAVAQNFEAFCFLGEPR